jgi:hypothetical protein
MSETIRLGLPLVQPAQAQKHVTVNAGLERLDALVQLRLVSTSTTVPPEPASGVYSVPPGAVNAWSGHTGVLAIASNGGWDFVAPALGWSAWIDDIGTGAVFDGTDWIEGAATMSAHGAGLSLRTIEIDHDVLSGPASTTGPVIPAQCFVYGVTGRVLEEISGDATAFQLGIGGDSSDRYGSGYGLGLGSWLRGLTASPLAYYVATPLTLTAEGGSFAGGRIRLAVHVAELRLPGL